MKFIYGLVAGLAALGLYAALIYGFYLIHPGLGWIVGALLVLINALRHTPEARARREAAARKARLSVEREEIADIERQRENNNARYAATSIRRRGIN